MSSVLKEIRRYWKKKGTCKGCPFLNRGVDNNCALRAVPAEWRLDEIWSEVEECRRKEQPKDINTIVAEKFVEIGKKNLLI
jgi:hypothetical protein